MISVRGRNLVIPPSERQIGTNFDNHAEMRMFSVGRCMPGGIDISHLVFHIDLKYAGQQYDTCQVEKEIQEEEIILSWLIPASCVQKPGTVWVALRGTDNNGTVKWATNPGALYVEDTVDTPANVGLTELEQMEKLVDQALGKCDEVIGESEEIKNDAQVALNNANEALGNVEALQQDLKERVESGEFKGDKGDPGEPGQKGESGIMAPSSGMFSLFLDPETGNLYADYPTGAYPPSFEYDQETGDLYYVIDREGEPGTFSTCGIPAGGDAGQVLSKATAESYDVEWADTADNIQLNDGVLQLVSGDKPIGTGIRLQVGSREIEMKNDGTSIVWRYTDSNDWSTLINLADMRGKDGITPEFAIRNGRLYVIYPD